MGRRGNRLNTAGSSSSFAWNWCVIQSSASRLDPVSFLFLFPQTGSSDDTERTSNVSSTTSRGP